MPPSLRSIQTVIPGIARSIAPTTKNYNVYWGSHIESQHSQNLRANGKVFIVVYDSTVAPGLGEGVYIKASVIEITDTEEIKAAYMLLQNKRPNQYWKLEELQSDKPVHLFKATPESIWTNGGGEKNGQYIDTRVEATKDTSIRAK
ncbi:MAG TPA: hypothetical protein VLH38_01155 [Patescibacteria group bacterium]|nr:hypothetical protein [Patescibacteria group bacterium]